MDVISAVEVIRKIGNKYDKLKADQIMEKAQSIGGQVPSLHVCVAKKHAQTGDVAGFRKHLQVAREVLAKAAPKDGTQFPGYEDFEKIMAAISCASRFPVKAVEHFQSKT